jgi:hypothetical protein
MLEKQKPSKALKPAVNSSFQPQAISQKKSTYMLNGIRRQEVTHPIHLVCQRSPKKSDARISSHSSNVEWLKHCQHSSAYAIVEVEANVVLFAAELLSLWFGRSRAR